MQGEGAITFEPMGYLTAFEVGLDFKWFVDTVWVEPTDRRMTFVSAFM